MCRLTEQTRRVARCALATLVVGALAAFAALPGPAAAAPAPELRPDLVQRTPWNVGVRPDDGDFALGFDSAVENRGDGPLLVHGHRTAAQLDMTADQVIRRTDGTRRRVTAVGRIRYTRSGGHDHWHFLKAVRYELRRASDHALVRPDQKTGFCLGDRYDTGRSYPRKPARAVITTSCRLYEPGARSLWMGISVGYGDDYDAYLEGQSIDVTRLPTGRYELVHRANPVRRLHEIRYGNNASSVLVRVRWPGGFARAPDVDVLARCPGRERCTG